MPMRRRRTAATGEQGAHYVKGVVIGHNCIFNENPLQNDLGIDAHVEFIVGEEATGCSVALQIKSGPSYRSSSGHYVLRADRNHLDYWSSLLVPVGAMIADPDAGTAAWCDVTEYLESNPATIDSGPYTIPAEHRFDSETFGEFRDHFLWCCER